MLPAIDGAMNGAPLNPADIEEMARRELAAHMERVRSMAGDLEMRADKVAALRKPLEQVWYENLRAYYGRYDHTTEARLKAEKKSRLFVRKTGARCRDWIARITDMLFPADEDNWSIRPTPIPELKRDQKRYPADTERGQALRETLQKAQQAADAMREEMRDQLTECRYNAACRDAIQDMVILGTAIMKGPVLGGHRGRYAAQDDGQGGQAWGKVMMPDATPKYERVDPWDFFPDPAATDIRDAEFTFQRHLPTAKKLREWAKCGFYQDPIRRLLQAGPVTVVPDYIDTVSMIINNRPSNVEKRWVVWEYRGPVTGDQLSDLLRSAGQEAPEEADPLAEEQVVVYVCQGEVLYFGLHPLDSGCSLYSACPFVRDTSSIFGWGVPPLMADSQAAINAAWRMMMDNGGLSTGPQIVINRDLVEPADGNWSMEPRKVWLAKGNTPSNVPAFQTFAVDSRQTELSNVIQIADQMADEETGMPPQARGEPGMMQTTAATGIAMLLNNANVIFRSVVRSFDDDITVPNITRLYEFNMLHSPDDTIKGDMKVDALGSSVLLVREMQAQNLMLVLDKYSQHPVLGPMTKVPEAYRQMLRSQGIPADTIVKTDDEIAEEQRQQSGQPPAPDPEMLRLEVQKQIAELEQQTKLQTAAMERDTAMYRLAAEQNMQIEELKAMMAKSQMEADRDERVMAAEVGFKDRQTRAALAARAVAAPGNGAPVIPPGTRFAP